MAPKRISLVERQQKLLEEKGFSKPQAQQPQSTYAANYVTRVQPQNFQARQEAHLAKTGRGNATAASRRAASLPNLDDDDAGDADDGRSAGGRSVASHAPSLHPSMAGSVMSMACSETTIGAGDDTTYWDFQHRTVQKKDIGHMCRECRQPFTKVGEPLTERRGARTSMRYHAECFSGFADPRSQVRSSHHEGTLSGTQMDAAPAGRFSKMRTDTHFEQGGRIAVPGGMGGKFGAQMGLGSNSFGSKSSKGTGVAQPRRAPGGMTESQLKQHDEHMASISEEPSPS